MSPIIGITPALEDTRFFLNKKYISAVLDNGGLPLILLNKELLSKVDGLILSGGGDIDSSFFGQPPHPKIDTVYIERDEFELELYAEAKKMNIPILGICRGLQLINVAEGGTLIQHIENHSFSPRDALIHDVIINKESILYDIVKTSQISVNSIHHQVIDKAGRDIRITAYSKDNFPEAIEVLNSEILAVQWHPEELYKNHEAHQKLFRHFISKAMAYRQ